MERMNILAIGAHPDDIEFGCGGTLAKYAKRGHHVFLMVMTEGDQGGEPPVRTREQLASNEILGVKEIFWGGYMDTKISADQATIMQLERIIRKVQPNFILTHFTDDTHQDHRHLSQVTISATRYIRNVLFYEGPTSQYFSPQVYVDISETMDTKMKALEAHASQVEKTNIEDRSIIELVQSTATFRGVQGRVKYAEAFAAVRLFINI